jgi:folate-binding protein YgfZ
MAEVTGFWLQRDFVGVRGPDAADWLNGQLSQDLAAVPVGGAALSFLLQPQGKVDALLRVQRRTDDEFMLDTDGGFGSAVEARLLRFKLRVKADVEAAAWKCLALRGVGAAEAAPEGIDATWLGWPGADLVGPEPGWPAGVPEGDGAAYELARIEAGVPVMGAEITGKTIPAELGPWVIERAVSFTKGCYTGQELVARIESRGGHVPRRLRRLTVDEGTLEPGASVALGEKTVGSVTSAAARPDGGAVALAFVGRDVEPSTIVTVTGADQVSQEATVSSIEDSP